MKHWIVLLVVLVGLVICACTVGGKERSADLVAAQEKESAPRSFVRR